MADRRETAERSGTENVSACSGGSRQAGSIRKNPRWRNVKTALSENSTLVEGVNVYGNNRVNTQTAGKQSTPALLFIAFITIFIISHNGGIT